MREGSQVLVGLFWFFVWLVGVLKFCLVLILFFVVLSLKS